MIMVTGSWNWTFKKLQLGFSTYYIHLPLLRCKTQWMTFLQLTQARTLTYSWETRDYHQGHTTIMCFQHKRKNAASKIHRSTFVLCQTFIVRNFIWRDQFDKGESWREKTGMLMIILPNTRKEKKAWQQVWRLVGGNLVGFGNYLL